MINGPDQFAKIGWEFLCDSANTMVLVLDFDGNITYANHYSKKLTGLSLEGDHLQAILLIGSWNNSDHPSLLKQWQDQTSPHLMNISISGDLPQTLYVTVYPIQEGYLLFGQKDEHEMDRLNREVLDLNQELSHISRELTQKNAELAQVNNELDEKVQERTVEVTRLLTLHTDLITQIGHDLKSPLTSLMVLLPYINKKVTDPDLRKLLEIVILDANRMDLIFSGLLALSILDIKSPDELVGKSQASYIVDRVISVEHQKISQNHLHITNLISPSLIMKMNESLCILLFSNIIGNAVKYSRMNGTIKVSMEVNMDTFCFEVQDDGIGIAPEHLARIFEEFFKTDSSRHDRDSSGLGLALVLRIVKLFEGTITAESEGVNMGTMIRVCFPLRMMINNSV